jgi:hypothetical protein
MLKYKIREGFKLGYFGNSFFERPAASARTSEEGFAEDDCIDIKFDSEGYQNQIGADGHVVRYHSPSNKLLSAMYNGRS